ncbi:MAG: sulfate permease [Methylococcales bacterium]
MNVSSNKPTLGSRLTALFPILDWLRDYQRTDFSSDLIAGIITAILLVPQGIAYAMLAGLPAQVGLYASILPPAIYALLGTSRTLSVGPVSIAAIMIASALSAPEIIDQGDPVTNAMILAAETGVILSLLSVFRMGTLVNFISHPVLVGFTSGAALLIMYSQLGHLLGIGKLSCGLNIFCFEDMFQRIKPAAMTIGVLSVAMLIFFNKPLPRLLKHYHITPVLVTAISKSGPLLVVLAGAFIASKLATDNGIVAPTVGSVPAGLPNFSIELIYADTWQLLLPAAVFIALIAYVESIAIAKVTANIKRQRIEPNQELIALGSANLAAAFTGGMPVAGGFSRTMVNFSAGAVTQMAMLIAAGILACAVLFFTDVFENILKTSLAAVILVAIAPLVKPYAIVKYWSYDHSDCAAAALTLVGVLTLGIEQGLGLGIAITLLSYLWRTSRPHIAVVGEVANTEHYRNIKRHDVTTWPHLLLIRVDENLTFANAGYIENYIHYEVIQRPELRHVVLIFASVSYIDTTALEALENLHTSLATNTITLHLAEVKGPVMDKLVQTSFLKKLTPGKIFFRTREAVTELAS